jgi:hypothetical protein
MRWIVDDLNGRKIEESTRWDENDDASNARLLQLLDNKEWRVVSIRGGDSNLVILVLRIAWRTGITVCLDDCELFDDATWHCTNTDKFSNGTVQLQMSGCGYTRARSRREERLQTAILWAQAATPDSILGRLASMDGDRAVQRAILKMV